MGPPRASISLLGTPLPDKGKPAARRGRKATGQAESLTAGLPKEGECSLPGTWWSSAKGDHDVSGDPVGRSAGVRDAPGRLAHHTRRSPIPGERDGERVASVAGERGGHGDGERVPHDRADRGAVQAGQLRAGSPGDRVPVSRHVERGEYRQWRPYPHGRSPVQRWERGDRKSTRLNSSH